jgi:acyl CoA:acetate/3-ketoacid CoA transferase beta subunit
MKKIFTLFFLTTAMLSAMAQGGHTLMKFSGKATIDVSGNTVSTLVSDTVKYSGSDVTLPEMRYGQMVIPSFTIHGVQFSMDMSLENRTP